MVYFDHNASSPLDNEVLQCMMPYLQNVHANPSSLHQSGRLAKNAIETARIQIAKAINCELKQVVFTSGGTEANNMLLQSQCNKLIGVGAVEHASILELATTMKGVHLIPVNKQGVYQFSLESIDVGLVSLQLVNNETGVVQPVQNLKKRYKSCLFHTDASQALGKLPVDFKALGVDFMTLSAHKFNGPKGAGVLIIKNPEAFQSMLLGGFQENHLRAGTENVPAIVGMGQAAEIAQQNLDARMDQFAVLRAHFEQQLKQIDGVNIFSEHVDRVCNTSFFALPYFHGETLLMECDKAGFQLASGSACHSSVTTASHVLQAMGVDESLSLNAVRASFGVGNSIQQVDDFIQFLQVKLENLPASIKSAVGFQ